MFQDAGADNGAKVLGEVRIAVVLRVGALAWHQGAIAAAGADGREKAGLYEYRARHLQSSIYNPRIDAPLMIKLRIEDCR